MGRVAVQKILGRKSVGLPLGTAVLLSLLQLWLGTPMGYASMSAETAGAGSIPEDFSEYNLETITVEAKRPDWETKLSPGTVTVIRPEDYKGEQKSLPDLLREVPGVHVREVNGKGQYTTVTVRGSTAAQVGIFVDGVLTNLGGDAAVDISTIPVKNVERIEVYRGYIPARFGGTFMGGVINIVTKKPTKIGASAEVGKTSLGGDSVAIEVTAPLGDGSLLFGVNYEDSDGDFKYDNIATKRILPHLQLTVDSLGNSISNFYRRRVDIAQESGKTTLSPEQFEYYKNHIDEWQNFVNNTGTNPNSGLYQNVRDKYYNVSTERINEGLGFDDRAVELVKNSEKADAYLEMAKFVYPWYDNATDDRKERVLDQVIKDDWDGRYSYGGVISKQTDHSYDDKNPPGDKYYDPTFREKMIKEYLERYAAPDADRNAAEFVDGMKDEKNLESLKKQKKEAEKRLQQAKDKRRYRRYNDYRNSSVLAKWQNQNWMAKLSWNEINRHLPDSVWGDSANDAMDSYRTDLEDIYYAESRRQKLSNTEALLQHRSQVGRLEWGWQFDYLHQNKRYRTETKLEYPDNFRWKQVPLREWSRYKSNKYNGQIDGTYQLDSRNLLDFQVNYSHERLGVEGSLMDKVLGDDVIGNLLGQMRNRYDQNIFNFQMQDSINLDSKGTLVLTPAIRYNQSKIIGYSDGNRFKENQKSRFHWLHPKDSQTNGKGTWQIALKKQFDDHFTLRATGGTYYRLLNMYEIAGDGAGILPASRDGSENVFPLPEEGKQFDFSALWNGKVLGADNTTTVTYFWRHSDNMLQLYRAGLDYWSYFNDNRGQAHGWELQSNFKWKKFELDAKATQTIKTVQRRNSSVHYDWMEVHPTYQPEWETNVRLIYHPTDRWAVFGEMHYTDSYFTHYSTSIAGGLENYLAGKPTSNLTVYNAGIKWTPSPSWLVAFGCNDIFNRGPKQRVRSSTYSYEPGYINVEYPLQGRTYYATVKYMF